MDVRDLVRSHYGAGDLSGAILGALAAAGTDLDHLGPADLFPVDQLHAGGAPATKHVLDCLFTPDLQHPSSSNDGLTSEGPDRVGRRLLDVGCGIGGTSRMAAMSGTTVTGIDLTPEFVETATDLTARVGLEDSARFLATAGESLPFDEASFDAAIMIHVGMNIPDKQSVFAEVHRVLVPGARFALFEQVRTAAGDLPFPLPWAEDERSSFVGTVEEYSEALAGAGFTLDEVQDRTASTLGPPPGGPLSPIAVFGPAFAERVGNNVAATRQGLLGALLILARA